MKRLRSVLFSVASTAMPTLAGGGGSHGDDGDAGNDEGSGKGGGGSAPSVTGSVPVIKMVKVQGGAFIMGRTAGQGNDYEDYEEPAHSVTLSDFYIGETEVTQTQWKSVMGENDPVLLTQTFPGGDKPMADVNWDDAQAFITALNAQTGKNYRLPTEAEWEYAARGGQQSHDYKYSGSDTVDGVAWYFENSDFTTHRVKTKAPNELGLYDMTGNVCEWVSDWYGDYGGAAQTNPAGPDTGAYRVTRGGAWSNDMWYLRVSYRYEVNPGYRAGTLGFRLASASE